jgi:hypothetical protein
MQRAAQKMVEFANSVRGKSGRNLYFSFAERNYWEGSRYFFASITSRRTSS